MVRVGLARSHESYEAVRRALDLVREDVCVPDDLPVLVNPNLVSTTVELATTPVDAVRATMDFLTEMGVKTFVVGEAAGESGATMEAFERFGYMTLKEDYDVELRDLNRDELISFEVLGPNLKPSVVRLAKSYFTSYVVSVARMKTHVKVVVTLAIKNMAVGSIFHPDRPNAKQIFSHDPQPINLSLARLNQSACPGLAVVDGVVGMEGNGPITGTPIRSGVALAGTDALAVDVVGAELMGFDPRTVGYLWYLGQLNRLSREQIEVVGEDPSHCVTRYRPHDTFAQQLPWWVEDWRSYVGGSYLR